MDKLARYREWLDNYDRDINLQKLDKQWIINRIAECTENIKSMMNTEKTEKTEKTSLFDCIA